jgi:Secretion system C-terminal sorting domain
MTKRLLFLNLILVLFISAAKAGEDTTGTSQGDSVDVFTAFSAGIKDYKIHLIWKITNPKDLSYFEVQRKDSKSTDYSTLNKNEPVQRNDFFDKYTDENNKVVLKFNYVDDPETDGVYYYRLIAFDSKRQVIFDSDEIKIGISGIKDFKLEQNHPNPFNPTTNIKYELFNESHVTLKVYDLIGREIATLVDETQPKGEYSVDFDASKYSNLTSGIYFYKLTTEKYSDVRKMILTK